MRLEMAYVGTDRLYMRVTLRINGKIVFTVPERHMQFVGDVLSTNCSRRTIRKLKKHFDQSVNKF